MMPRGGNGNFIGIYAEYPSGDLNDLGWADDEEAIVMAVDHMFSMCGNAGQEAIIGNAAADFSEWAINALESSSADTSYGSYVAAIQTSVGYSAWFGTQEIWDEGYEMLSAQSAYHDGKPDKGGAAKEF